MADYHFESNGLFLGFLSYPYYVDGKKIFEDVVLQFFAAYKDRLAKYDSDVMNKSLYKPAAYRMFGTQGLAVLSLIDDYSFCSRHFNKNHIRTLLENKSIDEDLYKFKSVIVTGVTETPTDAIGIEGKAEGTFLREEGKYPYIGVIRLKIDHRLLIGKGEKAIRAIRRRIRAIFDGIPDQVWCSRNTESDYIVVDCFDNDEMTIVAFSNSIKALIHFLGNVRNIKSTEDQDLTYKENGETYEKHVFVYTYINFGYDVKKDDPSNPVKMFLSSVGGESDVKLNCLIETRPGHRDSYVDYLKCQVSSLNVEEKIASGGSVLKTTLLLTEIHTLEELCKKEPTIRDVRKMRVSFQDPIKEGGHKDFENHANNYTPESLNLDEVNDIKRIMKSVGVSKIVRDRLMALFEFYDSSRRNLIQTLYFQELSGISSIFHSIIEDLSKNPYVDVMGVEEILDAEITNMENACYDRIHNRKYAENLLEYCGGIQQHLTAFGYAYNKINNILSGNIQEKETYTIITGADRVSSERTHLNLNINHILFPELFVTTAWKESANKNIIILDRYHFEDVVAVLKPFFAGHDNQAETNKANNRFLDILNIWHDFIKNKNNFIHIKNLILQKTRMLLNNDETFNVFTKIMNEGLLSYFIKDYVVFHFAFQRDFEKMWYFSFKVLLQTTNAYQRLGKIKRVHVIYMLLRLFMIGLRLDSVNDNGKCKDFINAQKYRPFDSILQGYWLECYDKTFTIAQYLFETLNEYGFKQVSEFQVSMCEFHAEALSETSDEASAFTACFEGKDTISLDLVAKVNNKCLERRKEIINKFEDFFEKQMLIEYESNSPSEYIICLLSSFVSEVYKIDIKGGNGNSYPIKSVLRNEKGEIIDKWENKSNEYKEICENMINILCDTMGGFLLPHSSVRQRYFALRTVFYKSLWDFRMKNDKTIVE